MEDIRSVDVSVLRLPAELVRRIAACLATLAPNEVPCSLRLVCKETAAALRGPGHTTVRLSLPVPPGAFAERWTRPDATRPLTLSQRQRLLRLTAASGVLANLEVAVRVAGLLLEQHVLHAAAGAGQGAVCAWLREQGLVWDEEVLEAAAEGGHLELCRALRAGSSSSMGYALVAAAGSGNAQLVEWLRGQGCPWDEQAAEMAARRGHIDIMETLLRQHAAGPSERPISYWRLMCDAAWGCGFDNFRTVHAWCMDRGAAAGERANTAALQFRRAEVLQSACLSLTPDWADKAAWLMDTQGYPPAVEQAHRAADLAQAAMRRPNAVPWLTWMRRRGLLTPGYALRLLQAAVHVGNTAALAELLDGGAALSASVACLAAKQGHLPALQLLHARGWPLAADGSSHDVLLAAAGAGRMEALDWLERTVCRGSPGGLQGEQLLAVSKALFHAAFDGSAPALRWLTHRGAAEAVRTLLPSIDRTSVEVVEFLAERGWLPLDDADGAPFLWAGRYGNLPVLAALRRLGCRWSAATFTEAVCRQLPLHVLRWLVAEGCPVDVEEARAAMRGHSDDGQEEEYLALLDALTLR